METLRFILDNLPLLGHSTVEHLAMVTTALGVALATGVPLGIAITLDKTAAAVVLYVAAVVITIPSVALFGLLIPLFAPFGHGIGCVPAVTALILYSQLPIIRSTYTAVTNVDPALREAARGMGLTALQRLWEVELPLAFPVIMSGVRNAAALTIGIAAIATYIGAGGLGAFISRGIASTDVRQPFITGAISISLLAMVFDLSLLSLQRRLTSPGLRT